MTLNLVLFDCDGTLANSEGFVTRCAVKSFGEEGVTHLLDENIGAFRSMSLGGFFAHIGDQLTPAQNANIQSRFRTLLRSERESGKLCEPLFDGLTPVLEQLDAQGYLLGVATNKGSHGLASVLSSNNVAHLFTTLHTSDNSPTKPAPDMVYNALKATGVDKENCILVGDTMADVLLARNAGIRCIGATWNHSSRIAPHEVECIADSVDALIPSIHKLLPPQKDAA